MLSLASLYLLFLLIIFLFQRKLIYFPETYSPDKQTKIISSFNLKPWPVPKNYRGFISQNTPTQSKGTVLIFHGNAGSARSRLYYIAALERLGYRVVLAEYPGYGARTGSPSESIFIKDGVRTARLTQQKFNGPLFLWGESIGAGVVSGIVKTGKVKVKGIILMTPFDSLTNVAQKHYWFFLAKWLIRDKFDNMANLKNYTGHTAVILAEQDTIIPKQNTLNLFNSIDGNKKLWKFPNAGHNSVPIHPDLLWWGEVMKFIDPKK